MNHQEIPKEKIWKYAKCELERRFLLNAKPSLIDHSHFKEITDKYLDQTHLRIRETFDGRTHLYKLTKKLPVNLAESEIQWVSTIYLSEAEYETFMTLPGKVIRKKTVLLSNPFP